MSPGRSERWVLILLFVVVLSTTGCGNQGAGHTSSRDREGGASSPTTATPAETPASSDESPGDEESAREAEARVAGPKRAEIMRRLYGRRLRVDHKSVVIDRATLACGREGTVRVGKQRRIRLGCLQPTFPPGTLVGPDAIFFVHTTPAGRVVVTNARLSSY